MLSEYISKLPQNLKPFAPFPSWTGRAEWSMLPAGLAAQLVARGEQYLGFSYPQILATDYMAYCRTGNRVNFEDKYFARRRALCALVLAECAECKGRFMDDIVNAVLLICEESGWQLPAHNTYVRDTPAWPLPDCTRPLLDLFACETGALLAVAGYLLKGKLATHSPLVVKRMAHELNVRILTPYLTDWFWWMGGHGESTNNWTVWCTQNVLICAFLSDIPAADRFSIMKKAADSTDAFLDEYGEDGCCDEGAQYYRHAGLCLFNILEILNNVSGGTFAPLWRHVKIRNIARYILNVHVDGPYYINFADCSPIAGPAGAREFLFGKRCNDAELCDFAAAQWLNCEEKNLPEECNLFYRTQSAFTAQEMTGHSRNAVIQHPEIYYPSTGLFIARDCTYCLAVKAGGNDDSHNHNDVGSFMLYKSGVPFLIDIGVESYTAKTFSAQRYDIWTMQSSWHNLPDFDGLMQQAGERFCAADVRTAFSDAESAISMQLKNAWPPESRLKSYSRSVTLFKNKQVVLLDTCEGAYQAAVLNLMFCQKPEVHANSIVISELGSITVEGGTGISCQAIPVSDARLLLAWPDTLYRVRIAFDKTLALTIT